MEKLENQICTAGKSHSKGFIGNSASGGTDIINS